MRLENILYICFTSILLTSVGIAYNVFYIRVLFSDRIQSPVLGWILGLTFNLFWLLTVFTYLKTAFSSPGCIVFSEKLLKHLQEEEQSNVVCSSSINKERVESELIEGVSTQTKKQCKELLLRKDEENQQITQKYSYSVKGLEDIQINGSMRCRVCGNFKLIRMHHCRSCDKCIFRRDHHCPWIGNCVGIGNHKLFIQFLGYAAITLLLIAFPILIDFTGNGLGVANSRKEFIPYVILGTLLIMSCAFSISICILFSFHIYLACNNQTTLELNNSVSSNIQRAFDRGSKYFNLVEIFGEKFSYRWFLPVTPSFGETFKIKCDSYELNIT